ncbi:F-box/kelch-repeat protein At3g23880-like [Apium graveolens]|uniref:F-box/kelch-repeat protein At3g23880-like n=1 Tax=Apium graveolens TaxID=4045 RepID=UPI003D7ABDFA
MAVIRPNPTLSNDLISEILVRLPVKSILCFQLVCKDWLSLIKCPTFVKSQLLHAITTQTDPTFIISRYEHHQKKIFSLLHANSREIVADLQIPYSPGDFNTIIVGSANGIVCFVVAVNFPKYKASIYLWNPAIRRSKLIPSYSNELRRWLGYDGFGYDPIDDDYKVVRVLSRPSSSSKHRLFSAEVYSTNNNVWRKVLDPIDIPSMGNFDVCVNGYLCSIGKYGMMSFDLNKEVFNFATKLPVICDHDEARIIEFNKSIAIAILINASNDDETDWKLDRMLDKKINMWSLDDDTCLSGGGVEASWTMMFSIDLAMPVELCLGYFCNRDLLLLIRGNDYTWKSWNDYKWISCNADKREAKIIPLPVYMAKRNYYCDLDKYTESLVSLAGFEQVNWPAGGDDN